MSFHLIQSIFINLPITTAYQQLWQLVSSADGLQAFNHYFKTNKITKHKSDSFVREISLRVAHKINDKNQLLEQNQQNINTIQQVIRNQKERKIIYKNINSKSTLQMLSGQFFHQFEQNNKGQTYLIFASSARKGMKCFPQKSQAEIQLIKLKDLLENGFQKHIKNKHQCIKKCC